MAKKLKGKKVEVVELMFKKPVEELLNKFEESMTPNRLVAERLNTPLATINYWRKKIGYPKRKF